MSDENKKENQTLAQIYQLLDDVQTQLTQLKRLVSEWSPLAEQQTIKTKAAEVGSVGGSHYGKVIEGVFDGQHMVGPDGKVYSIPPNYASKSKLLEGDILKLTVTGDGSFIYKQIGPVKRIRKVAALVKDEQTGNFRALTKEGRSYRLILASVTYYKGEPGDRVVILIPAQMESKWAAVENIVKQGEEDIAVEDYEDDLEGEVVNDPEVDAENADEAGADPNHLLTLGDEGELADGQHENDGQ